LLRGFTTSTIPNGATCLWDYTIGVDTVCTGTCEMPDAGDAGDGGACMTVGAANPGGGGPTCENTPNPCASWPGTVVTSCVDGAGGGYTATCCPGLPDAAVDSSPVAADDGGGP
jgi:hypothetical protein